MKLDNNKESRMKEELGQISQVVASHKISKVFGKYFENGIDLETGKQRQPHEPIKFNC